MGVAVKHLGFLCGFLWLLTSGTSFAVTLGDGTLASPYAAEKLSLTEKSATELRPDGFRKIGDRSTTTWLTPVGPGERALAFNPANGLTAVELLTGTDNPSAQTGSAVLELNSLNVDHPTGPFVPWPFLLISAGFALLLWASQKQKSV